MFINDLENTNNDFTIEPENYLIPISELDYTKIGSILSAIDRTTFHAISYRLASMPHAQCHVNIVKIDRDVYEPIYIIYLKSYTTIVAGYVLDNDYIYQFCTGTYSATTAKHISKFASEFYPPFDYYSFKYLANHDSQVKIHCDFTAMHCIISQAERYMNGNATWKNPAYRYGTR